MRNELGLRSLLPYAVSSQQELVTLVMKALRQLDNNNDDIQATTAAALAGVYASTGIAELKAQAFKAQSLSADEATQHRTTSVSDCHPPVQASRWEATDGTLSTRDRAEPNACHAKKASLLMFMHSSG